MNAKELVLATVLLERTVHCNSGVLCVSSVRPLLLSTLCIAAQVCNDEELTPGMAYDAVFVYLPLLEWRSFAASIGVTLNAIAWYIPDNPEQYQLYANELTQAANRLGNTNRAPIRCFADGTCSAC